MSQKLKSGEDLPICVSVNSTAEFDPPHGSCKGPQHPVVIH